MEYFRLSAVLPALLMLTTSAANADASLHDLGTLGAGVSSYVGMSADGSLIGGSSNLPGWISHAFSWENGVMTDVGTLGGTGSSFGGFSADGSVYVGYAYLPGNTQSHVFRIVNGVKTDLGTLGGDYSFYGGMSDDGSVIAGSSYLPGWVSHAFRWENGVMTDLGTLGGVSSSFGGISRDGSVIAGDSRIVTNAIHAYRWTGGVMTDLGTLGGTTSEFGGLSADGAVVGGTSQIAGNTQTHAFRWTGGVMTDLGTLGGTSSNFGGMSADGSVFAGESRITANAATHTYRWANGVMTDIGTLGGTLVTYKAMSPNGNTIIAESFVTGNTESHVVRWENGTLHDLGTLGGMNSFFGGMSSDAVMIAGSAQDGLGAFNAVRWVGLNGIEKISDILIAKGIDVTGWELARVNGVSADGNVLVGDGTLNGNSAVFVANVAYAGLITQEDLAESLQSVQQVSNQVAAVSGVQLDQSLFQARNLIKFNSMAPTSFASAESLDAVSTASGGFNKDLWEMYTIGSFGAGQSNDFDNHDLNGTIGLKRSITPSLAMGGGVLASTGDSDLDFDGESKLSAIGLTGVAAFVPDEGNLRLYGSIFAANLNLDITRGYMNGSGLDSSRGSTDGFSYGAAGQVGWNVPINDRYSVMPYTDLRWSKTSIDAYSESGGAFAADFSDQDMTNTTLRLGLENNYRVSEDVNLMGRVAVAHRLSGDGNGVVASVGGLSQTLIGDAGDENWGEVGVGLGWQISERSYLSGELNARSGDTAEPAVSAIIGFSIKF